ncbi:hypothetical protein ACJX0J_028870, partial [Zea mays]
TFLYTPPFFEEDTSTKIKDFREITLKYSSILTLEYKYNCVTVFIKCCCHITVTFYIDVMDKALREATCFLIDRNVCYHYSLNIFDHMQDEDHFGMIFMEGEVNYSLGFGLCLIIYLMHFVQFNPQLDLHIITSRLPLEANNYYLCSGGEKYLTSSMCSLNIIHFSFSFLSKFCVYNFKEIIIMQQAFLMYHGFWLQEMIMQ